MSCRIVTLGIALFFVLCVLHASNAASINKRSHEIAQARSLRSAVARAYRPSHDDPAEEDSEEDDDEYDAEIVQQEILRNQQAQEESQEDSDEDDDDDDIRRRRRREAPAEEIVAPVEAVVEAVKPVVDEKDDHKIEEDKKEDDKKDEPESAVAAPVPVPVKKQPSVLILIRDALKKVTTELPTQQVATNALQYFQLFEHFLQQTIEQVIGDDDDEEEEATTIKAEAEAEAEVNVEDAANKIPEAVAPIPAPAVEEEVAQVAQVTVEETNPVVMPEQLDMPKKDVVVPETVASNNV